MEATHGEIEALVSDLTIFITNGVFTCLFEYHFSERLTTVRNETPPPLQHLLQF